MKRYVLTGLICVWLGGPLFASDPPKATGNVSGNLLAGPKVEDQAQQPGERPSNAAGALGGRDARRVQVPLQQWLAAVRELDLTAAQTRTVGAIMAKFAAAQKEFNNSLSDEEREALERRRRPAADANQEPAPGGREQRELLQQIESRRPKPEAYQAQIWDELTPEQQSQLKEKLDAIKQRMLERRQNRREGDQMMQDGKPPAAEPDEPMMMSPRQTEGPAMGSAPEPPARRRANRRAAAADAANQLDAMGEQRLKFLLSRQSQDVSGRASTPNEESPAKRTDGLSNAAGGN